MALYTSHDVYYPGDKWVLQGFKRFSIQPLASDLWNEIWRDGATPSQRTSAVERLADLAESRLSARLSDS